MGPYPLLTTVLRGTRIRGEHVACLSTNQTCELTGAISGDALFRNIGNAVDVYTKRPSWGARMTSDSSWDATTDAVLKHIFRGFIRLARQHLTDLNDETEDQVVRLHNQISSVLTSHYLANGTEDEEIVALLTSSLNLESDVRRSRRLRLLPKLQQLQPAKYSLGRFWRHRDPDGPSIKQRLACHHHEHRRNGPSQILIMSPVAKVDILEMSLKLLIEEIPGCWDHLDSQWRTELPPRLCDILQGTESRLRLPTLEIVLGVLKSEDESDVSETFLQDRLARALAALSGSNDRAIVAKLKEIVQSLRSRPQWIPKLAQALYEQATSQQPALGCVAISLCFWSSTRNPTDRRVLFVTVSPTQQVDQQVNWYSAEMVKAVTQSLLHSSPDDDACETNDPEVVTAIENYESSFGRRGMIGPNTLLDQNFEDAFRAWTDRRRTRERERHQVEGIVVAPSVPTPGQPPEAGDVQATGSGDALHPEVVEGIAGS